MPIAKKPTIADRREFLAQAARTFLGVGLLPYGARAFAAPGDKAPKSCIYLYMNGGMSHLDTLDPKPGSETQGPVEVIDTNVSGITISEYLPLLADQVDKTAIIRSLSSTQGAHERGQYFMRTSYTQRGTIRHPAMGAWLTYFDEVSKGTLPKNVRIGNDSRHPGAGFMESKFSPLPIGDPAAGLQNSQRARGVSETQFESRLQLSDQLDGAFREKFNRKKLVRSYTSAYADAIRLMSSEELQAFNIYRESEAVRQEYGDTPFGQGCLLARRLVENGVRFIEVSLGGWDTHQSNFVRVPQQTQLLDRGLATLLRDLGERGLLDTTLVVLATEFGRTPTINQNEGRDHYPKAFSGLLAGAGIQGGQVFGQTDARGEEVEDDMVEIPDFNATIAHALELPLKKVVKSASQRPFTVAHKGTPILELFAS